MFYLVYFAIAAAIHLPGWVMGRIRCTSKATIDYASAGELERLEECYLGDTNDWGLNTKADQLVAAACGNHIEVAQWLTRRGAVVTRERRDLQCAAAFGFIDMLRLLLHNNPRDVNELDQALLLAASMSQNEAAEILIQYGTRGDAVVYCYEPFALAPPHMYDGIRGRLPTCRELSEKIADDINEEENKRIREERELRSHYPGMGLLEDPEDERKRKEEA